MKMIALLLVTGWTAWQASAAEQAWLTDFAKAQAQAKAEHKLILMDFNGSDWCPPCKALKKNVFSSPEFLEYAKKNLVLVDVDFPRQKKLSPEQTAANEALSKKFDVEGFPTVVILDSTGKELKKDAGYDGQTAKEYLADLEKLKAEKKAPAAGAADKPT
jgi:protein disulfide-isomerase